MNYFSPCFSFVFVFFCLFSLFVDRVSLHSLGCPGIHYVHQASLKLTETLCLPSIGIKDIHGPLHPAHLAISKEPEKLARWRVSAPACAGNCMLSAECTRVPMKQQNQRNHKACSRPDLQRWEATEKHRGQTPISLRSSFSKCWHCIAGPLS